MTGEYKNDNAKNGMRWLQVKLLKMQHSEMRVAMSQRLHITDLQGSSMTYHMQERRQQHASKHRTGLQSSLPTSRASGAHKVMHRDARRENEDAAPRATAGTAAAWAGTALPRSQKSTAATLTCATSNGLNVKPLSPVSHSVALTMSNSFSDTSLLDCLSPLPNTQKFTYSLPFQVPFQ